MYSQDKINIALQVYHQCGSVTNTIRMLGYPTRRTLYTWIENEGIPKAQRKPLENINTVAHPRNPSIEVKMDAIHRCLAWGKYKMCFRGDWLQPDKYLCLAKKISQRRHCRTNE